MHHQVAVAAPQASPGFHIKNIDADHAELKTFIPSEQLGEIQQYSPQKTMSYLPHVGAFNQSSNQIGQIGNTPNDTRLLQSNDQLREGLSTTGDKGNFQSLLSKSDLKSPKHASRKIKNVGTQDSQSRKLKNVAVGSAANEAVSQQIAAAATQQYLLTQITTTGTAENAQTAASAKRQYNHHSKQRRMFSPAQGGKQSQEIISDPVGQLSAVRGDIPTSGRPQTQSMLALTAKEIRQSNNKHPTEQLLYMQKRVSKQQSKIKNPGSCEISPLKPEKPRYSSAVSAEANALNVQSTRGKSSFFEALSPTMQHGNKLQIQDQKDDEMQRHQLQLQLRQEDTDINMRDHLQNYGRIPSSSVIENQLYLSRRQHKKQSDQVKDRRGKEQQDSIDSLPVFIPRKVSQKAMTTQVSQSSLYKVIAESEQVQASSNGGLTMDYNTSGLSPIKQDRSQVLRQERVPLTKKASARIVVNQNLDSLETIANRSQSSLEGTTQSIIQIENQKSGRPTVVDEKPMAQRISNIFATSPTNGNGQTSVQRPKTASFDNSLGKHPIGSEQTAANQQLQMYALHNMDQKQKLAYGQYIIQQKTQSIQAHSPQKIAMSQMQQQQQMKNMPHLPQHTHHQELYNNSQMQPTLVQSSLAAIWQEQLQQQQQQNQTPVMQQAIKEKQFKIKQVGAKNKRKLNSAARAPNKAVTSSGQTKKTAEKEERASETPFMNYLESFIQQQKVMDDDRIESEETQSHRIAAKAKEKQSAIPNSYTTELTQSFHEYKQVFQQQREKKQVIKTVNNQRLFSQTHTAHKITQSKTDMTEPATAFTGQPSQPAAISQKPQRAQFRIINTANGHEMQRQKYGNEASKSLNNNSLQTPNMQQHKQASQVMSPEPTLTNQSNQILERRPTVSLITQGVSHYRHQASSQTGGNPGSSSHHHQQTNYDDSATLKCLLAIVRSVQSRIDDIHVIRQSMDVKLRKARHVNIELFDDLKGRELARLTKEAPLIQTLSGLKQSDNVMTRRQINKHCKKIHKVFWNVIEAEEDSQELSQMQKYPHLYMASELQLLDIYTDKGEKIQVFRRSCAIQAKLLEAATREKEFDLNFCVALGVQKARQTFMNEVMRAASIHKEMVDTNTALMAQIRRAVKSMSDALGQKRLRAVTVNAKASRMFELLNWMNQEVNGFRNEYLTAYQAKYNRQSLSLINNKQSSPLSKRLQPSVANSLKQQQVYTKDQQASRSQSSQKTSSNHKASNPKSTATSQKYIRSRFEAGQRKRSNDSSKEKTLNPKESHKSNRSLDLQNQSTQRKVTFRKYKWQQIYQRESGPILARSHRIMKQNHYRRVEFPCIPPYLAADLDYYLQQYLYKHYSMKKANEHHLTMQVESRVLKIQKLARCFYQARTRAAKTIQIKLKELMFQRQKDLFAAAPANQNAVSTPKQQPFRSRQSSKSLAQKSEAILKASQHTDQKANPTGNSLQAINSPIATASISNLHLSNNQMQFKDASASIGASHLKIHPLNRFMERTKSEVQPQQFDLMILQSMEKQSLRAGEGEDIGGTIESLMAFKHDPSLQRMSSSPRVQPFSLFTMQSIPNPAAELIDEQQGSGAQILQRKLWGYYGSQHLAAVLFLQQAFRKHIQTKQRLRENRFTKFKHKVLHSSETQEIFRQFLFQKIKAQHLPSAMLDSRKLELIHGFQAHEQGFQKCIIQNARKLDEENRHNEQQSLATHVIKKLWSQETEKGDEERLQEFFQQKMAEDLATRIQSKLVWVKREHVEMRRRMFHRILLKNE